MVCALASPSGSWLLSQYTLRWGLRSASSRIRQRLDRLGARAPGCCWKAATSSSMLHRGTGRGGWCAGGHRQPIHALRGGKSAAGDLRAAHRGAPGGRVSNSADATGRRGDAHRPSWWPPAHWRVIGRGSPENELTAEDESLGCRMGAYQRRQPGVFISAQGYGGRNRHGHSACPSLRAGTSQSHTTMLIIFYPAAPERYWYRIYEMDI